MGSYDAVLLLGTDGDPQRVVAAVGHVLSTRAREVGKGSGLYSYVLTDTDTAWLMVTLDTGPLGLEASKDSEPWRGVRYEATIRSAGPTEQAERDAQHVYELLAAQTPWKLVLLDDDLGRIRAQRPAVTHAA